MKLLGGESVNAKVTKGYRNLILEWRKRRNRSGTVNKLANPSQGAKRAETLNESMTTSQELAEGQLSETS